LGLSTPTLLYVGRLGGFWRLSAGEQFSTQFVSLTFGLFASPARLGHPFAQRGLRHLAAGPLIVKLIPDLSRCGAGLCPIWGLLDRLGLLWRFYGRDPLQGGR
jgi:hypothetical protein